MSNCHVFDHALLLKLPLHDLLKSHFGYTCKVNITLQRATNDQRGVEV